MVTDGATGHVGIFENPEGNELVQRSSQRPEAVTKSCIESLFAEEGADRAVEILATLIGRLQTIIGYQAERAVRNAFNRETKNTRVPEWAQAVRSLDPETSLPEE